MNFAYQLFQQVSQEVYQAQDSPLIVCFRELWQRLSEGLQPSGRDLQQVDHMGHWLQGKVEQYEQTLSQAENLQPVFDTAQQGWALMLEGVYCLADFLEQGQTELLAEARNLSEEGELMLKQLEESIVAERDDEQPLCDGYLV